MFRKINAIAFFGALLSLTFAAQGAEIITLDAAKGVQAYTDSVVARLKPAEPGKVHALSVAGAEVKPYQIVPGLVELKRLPRPGLQALSQEQKVNDLLQWIDELKN